MKSYLYKIESRFENRNYFDYVIADSEEKAKYKFTCEYPNVKEILTIINMGVVIL